MTVGGVRQIHTADGIYPQFLSSDDFHPEFGCLCPTPRMRRKIRMIVASVSIGIVIGAISVLGLVHREGHEGDGRGSGPSAAVATATVPATDETPFMTLPLPAAVTSASGVPWASGPCQDPEQSFLDIRCERGKSGVARSRRAIAHRIVSLPIGRSAAMSDEPTVLKSKAATSGKGETIATIVDMAKASVVGAPDTPTSNTKPGIKSAHKYRQPPPPADKGLSAFAAAPSFGRNAFDRAPAPIGSRGWGPTW
jgi:hypothetical protein